MIQDWLESVIDDKITSTGNGKELHFNCPVCGETRHRMYVNETKGKVYCHNCQYKGSLVDLIQYVEDISYQKALQRYKEIAGTQYVPDEVSKVDIESIFMKDDLNTIKKRPIPLPESLFLINPKKPNIHSKKAIKYLHSRGITDRQILSCKMSLSLSEGWRDRVIIPVLEQGEPVFYVGRAIKRGVKMKEKSPTNEDYQISKSEVIFNLDNAIENYNSIVICEGIFDALSFGDIGVSLLGKVLYTEQLNKLLDYKDKINEIYIALDWDASQQATEMAEELSNWFKVNIINIPKKLDDPNNVFLKKGRQMLFDLLEDAEEYSCFSKLARKFRI